MSTADKRAGIYMIRNIKNGKVYIGATNNIQKRFTRYIQNYTHYSPSKWDCARMIEKTIHDEGWENFEFIILDEGPEYHDPIYRSRREMEYATKYRAIDPQFGYNSTIGGDVSYSRSEPKTETKLRLSPKEKCKHMAMFLYDTFDDSVTYVPLGQAVLCNKLQQSSATLLWSIRNGALVRKRYYVFFVNRDRRIDVYEFVKATRRDERGYVNGGNSQKAIDAFLKYEKAYIEVNRIAAKFHNQ